MTKPAGLGPKTMERLDAVGVRTPEDIRALGAVEIFRRLRARFPAWTTWNALYGLYAAEHGISWLAIPPGKRAALREAAGPHPTRRS
jgi:DNA transformation protein